MELYYVRKIVMEKKYFINLKTGDKVTVSEPYKHSAKIVLVADEITKGDVDRAQQLFDEKRD